MRITAKADYAVRAVIELALHVDEGPVTGDAIARAQDIPAKFCETILGDLRRAGIVSSQRGAVGGYWLAREAGTVSVADVIRAMEGPILNVRDQRPEQVHYSGSAEPLRDVWLAARVALRGVLEQVSVADLAAGALPPDIADRAGVGVGVHEPHEPLG